jgi:putative ABC transport system permease protein
MAAFQTQLRTKQVGIRKVLGAEDGSLIWLLSHEYVYLTAAAIAVGVPAAELSATADGGHHRPACYLTHRQ